MALICTSPPLIEPVSLCELKDMLRLDQGDSSQDDVLTTLNVAARSWCETITQRRFVEQSWTLMMDFFPGYIDMKLNGQKVSSPFVSGSNAVLVGIRYAMALPYPPVREVVEFTYQDANGTTTDMFNGSQDPNDWSFVQDVNSQPARLMPLFGQMWPVARVIANAVSTTYKVGYATPIQVTTTAGVATLGTATLSTTNIGQPISIPGAGRYGGTLNTIIQSVDGGVATLRDLPQTALSHPASALLVDHGSPQHWELIRVAIKFLVNSWFVERLPSFDDKTRDCIAAILGPVMDRRF
jgi:hypothetical protein